MYRFNNISEGTKCLAETTTKWYDLATRKYCPKLQHLEENRGLVPNDKAKRRDVKKSIVKEEMVLSPILCDKNYNIYDGQNRWKIANELWDSGIDVKLGITINPWLSDAKSSAVIRDRLVVLQKNSPWTPTDKLKSLSDSGNETAQFILKLAYTPAEYTKNGIYGIRNAFVAMGRNPDDFETIPYVCGQDDAETARRVYKETNYLLKLGIKSTDKANNWTEAFIKAWRRIRTNDPNLMKEDENGDRTVVNTKALNVMIDDIGLDTVGARWRCYADKAYASGKIGRWASVLEETITNTYDWKHRQADI